MPKFILDVEVHYTLEVEADTFEEASAKFPSANYEGWDCDTYHQVSDEDGNALEMW